jgi:hypothetical protein
MKILKSSTLLFTLLVSAIIHAQKVDMKVKLSPAGAFTISGTGLSGKVTKNGDTYVSENIVLDLRDLKSGIELRDKHVQEYFETDKYPQAVLIKGTGKDGKFVGDLKIREVVRRIEGTFETSDASGKAFFKVKMSDFRIKKAIYMGIGVNDEVAVEVEMPL